MVRRVVGASAGAGAGDDDGKDNREVRRFFEASARNLKMLNRPAPKTCARCQSENTHFSYYNNNQLTQPRFFCKTCRRFWTHGGALRNVPYGGRKRKNPPRHRKVVPTDIPSGDSLQQELIMPPQVLNSGQFAEVTEASLRMMPDLLLNHPQELPRWFTGESSVNPPPPPTPPQLLPQPQPQPQQQQQEVVNLNHADIDDDDDDDDLSYILQWSLDELLGSDDD